MRRHSNESRGSTVSCEKLLMVLYDIIPTIDMSEFANKLSILHVDINIEGSYVYMSQTPDIVWINCNSIDNITKSIIYCKLWHCDNIVIDNINYTDDIRINILEKLLIT